ncbi:MAG: efflux RND transporter periplasmic adaptor subunit [Thermodesulfobacteriota bacterium]|nr:efflux RND transporter periplasmic adaptor subunit [Thermodesulfobacteriota bacterium]
MSITINNNSGSKSSKRGILLAMGACILIASVAVSILLMKTGPKPKKRTPKKSYPMVETVEMKAKMCQVTIPAMGTIKPAVSISLKAQVSGKIKWIHPQFIPGGIIRKGETIIRIDPRDYELALTTKKADLESARYEYRLEQGQQEIAQKEWEILGQDKNSSELDRELALRKPHLKQKQAKLEAASAAVEIARLNLERAQIKAPFNAIVKTALVNVGDQASSSTSLAQLVGYDYYYLQLAVPVDSIKWINLPGEKSHGSLVEIYSTHGKRYSGRILQLLSDLEEQGRMARIIVKISDPLGIRKRGRKNSDSLLLGEFINAKIIGRYVDRVFRMLPEAVHDGKTVWLMDKDKRLAFKEIEILWRDDKYLYTRGLNNGDQLIVSDLPAPVMGMEIRRAGEKENDKFLSIGTKELSGRAGTYR